MPDQILSQADYTRLNTALGRIQNAADIIAKAEACGLDMTEPKAMLEQQKYQIEQIKRQFAPDKP